jgi:hypothetical protein
MPKKKKKRVLVRSEERDEGRERQTFKVRCALTYAFYMFVEAHDRDEAEYIAELHCRKHDKEDDIPFWESESSYQHSCFEAEEAD